MKALFTEMWMNDRKAFVRILCMNILASLLGGIGIVMLIPLLHMLDIGAEEASGLLAVLSAPMEGWPYAVRVAVLLGVYILLVTLKALLGRALAIRENTFVEDTGLRLRQRLYDAVASSSWEQLSVSRSADTISLFTSQCSQVSYGVNQITYLLASTVSAAIQLAIALWMNVPITLVVCLLGGTMLMIFRPLRRKSRDYGKEMIQINRDFYAELQNQLSSVKEVRAYGVEQEHAALFGNISAAFKDAHLRFTRLCTVPSVVYSIAAAVLIAAVYLISALILRVDTARLVVLVYVFARLWPLFSGWQGQLQYIQSCVPAYEKLTEEIGRMRGARESDDAADTAADFSSWREIRFENVGFRYQGAEAPTLRGASFALPRGSVTALLGRNGAGKTTVANLLLGFLTPTDGAITVDGTALDGRSIRAWRRMAGYVPQDPLILNASVRENLRRFHPDASEDDMIAALKTAMAWDFVSALPEGLDTQLGDRGVRLSGGERQRIVLARVLIGKPRLIILDEATSALDYESENAFREVIRAMSGEAAVVMIAHRLATIRLATQAIVLENGTIAEQGSMAELLNKPDSYLSGMVNVG